MSEKPTRRIAISAFAAGAAGAALPTRPASAQDSPPVSRAPASEPNGACTLMPQAVEGPFYFDPKLVRGDITEGRPGAAIKLTLRVIEAGPCTPVSGARVDIWHADASGWYSGYDRQGEGGANSTKGQTFLRGTQITDADGGVAFKTIYPGWYPGRTPHIHVKIFLDATTLVTGQVYFPDELSAKIYADREPYNARPKADTTNANDFIFREGEREGGGIIMAIEDGSDDIAASLLIAVDKSGAAAREGSGVGGFMRRILGR